MSYSTPPATTHSNAALFGDPSKAINARTKGPHLEQMLDNAETGEEILDIAASLSGKPLLTEEQAILMAEMPESNTAAIGAAQNQAIKQNESTQGFRYASDPASGRNIRDLARHLSAEEISSTNGQAILLTGHKLLKAMANAASTYEAEKAQKAFDDLEKELAAGAALTPDFVLKHANVAASITLASVTVSNQFFGFFDPTDSSNQRQIAHSITMEGTMQEQDSE